jgi:VIT1/CCC1 family predicted Fe2+/Mn2+ transporter
MFIAAAWVPLFPYLIWEVHTALAVSLAATAAALIAVGALKAQIAGMRLMRSGLHVLAIGSGAALIGFAVGELIPRLVS